MSITKNLKYLLNKPSQHFKVFLSENNFSYVYKENFYPTCSRVGQDMGQEKSIDYQPHLMSCNEFNYIRITLSLKFIWNMMISLVLTGYHILSTGEHVAGTAEHGCSVLYTYD